MDSGSIKTLKLIVVINLASLSFLILRFMNFLWCECIYLVGSSFSGLYQDFQRGRKAFVQ